MGSAIAATDPAAYGPYPGVRQTVVIPGTQGAMLTTDLYHPGTPGEVGVAAGNGPVIVLGHGFSQSKSQQVNQGLHLASRGYIVVIPDSNAASDHSRYADAGDMADPDRDNTASGEGLRRFLRLRVSKP
jgi:predicted dienelactone hydrolase